MKITESQLRSVVKKIVREQAVPESNSYAKEDQTPLKNMVDAIHNFNKGHNVKLSEIDMRRLQHAFDIVKFLSDDVNEALEMGDDEFTFGLVTES